MTAQSIGTGLMVAAVCVVAAFAALMRQAGRHCDDRAELLRGQLDAYRAGQASVLEPGAEDGEALECWERAELDRIEALYADEPDREGTP